MSRPLQWIIGFGILVIVAAVAFSLVGPFFLPRAAWPGSGMMPGFGPHGGTMGPGHMFGFWGGWLGPLVGGLMLLGPLALGGLLVLGLVWLARSFTAPRSAPPSPPAGATHFCAHCGQPLQAGWKACPHCGEKVV